LAFHLDADHLNVENHMENLVKVMDKENQDSDLDGCLDMDLRMG